MTIENTSDDNKAIEADSFIAPADSLENDFISKLSTLYKESLFEAQRWFAVASDQHSRIESIYNASMNFKSNDDYIDKYSEIILHKLKSL